MMRRYQAATAAAAPAATCAPTMRRAAAPRTGQQLSARIDALARLPRGQLARAGDTLLAVQRGITGVFNVVEERGYADSTRARSALGWHPGLRV